MFLIEIPLGTLNYFYMSLYNKNICCICYWWYRYMHVHALLQWQRAGAPLSALLRRSAAVSAGHAHFLLQPAASHRYQIICHETVPPEDCIVLLKLRLMLCAYSSSTICPIETLKGNVFWIKFICAHIFKYVLLWSNHKSWNKNLLNIDYAWMPSQLWFK